MSIIEEPFGAASDGTPVSLFTLANSNGMQARITNFGCAIVSLTTPDRRGAFADVVLGFDTVQGYVNKHPSIGVVIGRCANRIRQARFTLNGVAHTLSKNSGENHAHGGTEGFHKKTWQARVTPRGGSTCLQLDYFSRDGEEGYPGNLSTTVFYSLTDDNALKLEYIATTDADTVLNLTNHSYFNLAGAGVGDILGHVLSIGADRFTPTDAEQIVTGEIHPVRGTPFDFTQPTPVGQRIVDAHEQLCFGSGYDLNYVLNSGGQALAQVAEVYEPGSGRVMQVLTTEPGVQLYTANKLDGSIIGKGSTPYKRYAGLCLECQHFPNSPNVPQFPSTVLKVGERYTQTTIYKFSAR